MKIPEDYYKISNYIENTEIQMAALIDSFDYKIKEHINYWKIFQLNHERTKFISDEFMNKNISKETFLYCCDKMYCDVGLRSYWKKQGYKKLCCLQCVTPQSDKKTVCKCRAVSGVKDTEFKCSYCGCSNCSG